MKVYVAEVSPSRFPYVYVCLQLWMMVYGGQISCQMQSMLQMWAEFDPLYEVCVVCVCRIQCRGVYV